MTDIYKLRSGTYKGCRIWSRIDLGTGFRIDLFMTNEQNELIQINEYEYIPKLPSENAVVTDEFLQTISEKEGNN